MAQLPMSEERRICAAKPIKPVACSFGFETQPFEFAARPADDIGHYWYCVLRTPWQQVMFNGAVRKVM